MTEAETTAAGRSRPVENDEPPLPFDGSLALPATGRDVAQFVAQRAAACVGADYSNVALLDPGGDSLRLFHGTFLDPDLAERYTDVPLDAPYPIAVAARECAVVLLPDLESYREHFTEILADTVAAGVQATASLPLYRADGTVLGALGFAWTEPTPLAGKLEAALRAVANLCVETVERAERFDAEHALIAELQARLIGDLPAHPGIGTAARYLPASGVRLLGGDWYEGMILDDGKVAFVVGDVAGHGIVAAADMTLIRGMISALLSSGISASDVFTELSAVVARRSVLVLATAALVIVDVATDTITFATAGHPPPLVRYLGGRTRTLDTANGPMIGLPDAEHAVDTAPFPPGAQLVMYTDGLVERRDQPFDVGVSRTMHHLATIADNVAPGDLISSLVETLMADIDPEDDIAVLVVEHTARPGQS